MTLVPVLVGTIGLVNPGVTSQAITPSGVASLESIGTPKLNMRIFASGVTSGQGVGAPLFRIATVIHPSGIQSLEAIGIPRMIPTASIAIVAGIVSLEGVGLVWIGGPIQAVIVSDGTRTIIADLGD